MTRLSKRENSHTCMRESLFLKIKVTKLIKRLSWLRNKKWPIFLVFITKKIINNNKLQCNKVLSAWQSLSMWKGGGCTISFWASSNSQQVHFIIYLFTWSLINLLKLFYFIIIFFVKKLQGIQFLSYQIIKCVCSELLVLIVWNYQLSKITWTSPIFRVVRLLPLVREPGNQTITLGYFSSI